MERYSKLWNIFVLGPLLFVPILAVEFPRILAYLPILPTIIGGLIVFKAKLTVPFPKMPLILIALFFGYGVVHSLFIAVYSDESLERLIKLLPVFIIGYLFLCILYAGRSLSSPNFLKYLLISCAAGALLTSFEILSNGSLYTLTRDEFPGDFVYNRGAVTIIFLALCAFFLSRHKQSKWFVLSFVPIAIMLSLVESQSSQIALIVGAFLYFLFPVSKKAFWITSYVFIALSMLVAPYLVQASFTILPDDIYDYQALQQSFVGHRMEIWNFISAQIFQNPLIGHGLEFTKFFDGFVSEQRFLKTSNVLHPHNFIIQIWIEFGLVGILFAIVVLGLTLKSLFLIKDIPLRRAVFTSLMMALLVSCFSYGMWQSWWLGLFFIIAGIYCAVYHNQVENTKSA